MLLLGIYLRVTISPLSPSRCFDYERRHGQIKSFNYYPLSSEPNPRNLRVKVTKNNRHFVDSTISSQVSITIVNAIPESESVIRLKNNEWSSKWPLTIDIHQKETFLWLHSMNDTNSNCDLGQIIRIIGLVWTRLVSQFIHSFIY